MKNELREALGRVLALLALNGETRNARETWPFLVTTLQLCKDAFPLLPPEGSGRTAYTHIIEPCRPGELPESPVDDVPGGFGHYVRTLSSLQRIPLEQRTQLRLKGFGRDINTQRYRALVLGLRDALRKELARLEREAVAAIRAGTLAVPGPAIVAVEEPTPPKAEPTPQRVLDAEAFLDRASFSRLERACHMAIAILLGDPTFTPREKDLISADIAARLSKVYAKNTSWDDACERAGTEIDGWMSGALTPPIRPIPPRKQREPKPTENQKKAKAAPLAAPPKPRLTIPPPPPSRPARHRGLASLADLRASLPSGDSVAAEKSAEKRPSSKPPAEAQTPASA